MYVDPRGPRFGAVLTTVVLIVVLATASGWLLLVQTAVFTAGGVFGLRWAPYGLVYRRLVRPRLDPPEELEAEGPPRFAQTVGLVFAAVGTAGYLGGLPALGTAATAVALFAAFLNAAFGVCLGCEVYVLALRLLRGTKLTRYVPARSLT